MAKTDVADVGVNLVIDSNAKAVIASMKSSLTGFAKSVGSKGGEIAGGISKGIGGAIAFGGGVSAGLAGVGLAVAGLGGLTAAAIKSGHAFYESEEQVRGLAGSFTLIDRNANSWEKLLGYADETKNELEDIGIRTGELDDTMVAVFNNIIERGGKAVEQAKTLTEQMALAGRAIPGGAMSLSQGFEMLQLGMVRARNPLVQLIATTGTLKGSAKSVAKEMQKLSIDKQMELAEKAIEKMADKMKTAPMTLGQMSKSMQVVVGNVFEAAGQPIVRALEPVMGKVRSLLVDNADMLYAAGSKFGDFIGTGISAMGPVVDTMTKSMVGAWDKVGATFKYMYDNRETFAKTMADGANALIKAGDVLVNAMAKVGTTFDKLAKSGWLGADVAKFAQEEEKSRASEELRRRILSTQPGGSAGPMDDLMGKIVGPEMLGLGDFNSVFNKAWQDHLGTLKSVSEAETDAMTLTTDRYAMMFDIASKAQDQGAMQYVAKFLEGNTKMQDALIKAGPELFKTGAEGFIKTLEEMGDKDIADKFRKSLAPNLGKVASVNQNFTGPISITQDFKEQDPDQIMVMFKKELGRAGVNRMQARTGRAYGI